MLKWAFWVDRDSNSFVIFQYEYSWMNIRTELTGRNTIQIPIRLRNGRRVNRRPTQLSFMEEPRHIAVFVHAKHERLKLPWKDTFMNQRSSDPPPQQFYFAEFSQLSDFELLTFVQTCGRLTVPQVWALDEILLVRAASPNSLIDDSDADDFFKYHPMS